MNRIAGAARLHRGPVHPAHGRRRSRRGDVLRRGDASRRAPTRAPARPAATGFNAEVERLIIRFDHSDDFKVSFGRYHTPINWWNTAFHHGQWLQTTISRPEMIQFGGRFLPVHFVGALVEGCVPSRRPEPELPGRRRQRPRRSSAAPATPATTTTSRAWLFNGFIKPDKLYGLQAGGSVYGDRSRCQRRRDFDEHIVAGHVVWQKEDPEMIAEVADVRHDAGRAPRRTGATRTTCRRPTDFRQLNHVLWKPYFRFEHIAVNPADVMFAGRAEPRRDDPRRALRRVDRTRRSRASTARGRAAGSQPRNYGGFFQVCFHVLTAMSRTSRRRTASTARRGRRCACVGAGPAALRRASRPTSPSS